MCFPIPKHPSKKTKKTPKHPRKRNSKNILNQKSLNHPRKKKNPKASQKKPTASQEKFPSVPGEKFPKHPRKNSQSIPGKMPKHPRKKWLQSHGFYILKSSFQSRGVLKDSEPCNHPSQGIPWRNGSFGCLCTGKRGQNSGQKFLRGDLKSLRAGFVSGSVAQSCTEHLRRNKYQYMLKDKV